MSHPDIGLHLILMVFVSAKKSRLSLERPRLQKLFLLAVAGAGAYLLAAQVVVHRAASDHLVTIDSAPSAPVVLVPGARVYQSGSPSPFLQQRLDAAESLHSTGAVDHILVSGDNRESHYNEPEAMRDYLLSNVAAKDVTLDYAGFDTWDTCIRAVEQFGVTKAIVVTQERYANRTAALCNQAGIDATVVALPTPPQAAGARTKATLRERFANVKAWRDMVTRPEPHHGGEFIGLVGSEDT